MNNGWKNKLILSLLAMVLLFQLSPAVSRNVIAATPSVSWDLADDGTLTISGTGDLPKTFSAMSEKPYGNPVSINKVIISDGITSIGKYTFYRCTNLTEVEIASSVKSIGACAFDDCRALSKITMPISCMMESDSFDNTAIDEVELVEGYAGCDYKESTYGYTPWAKSSSTPVKISLDANIKDIGDYTFYNGGDKYEFDDIVLDNVESIGVAAFEGDTGLINISLNNTSEAVLIQSRAFKNCSSITNMTIPVSFVPQRETFSGLTGLSEVVLGVGTKIGTDHSSSYVATPWYGDGSPLNITVEDGVTDIGPRTFYGCMRLSTIDLPDTIVNIGTAAFHGCSLTSFKMPAGTNAIADELLAECDKLTSLDLHSGIETIGKKAFWACSSLTDFTVPAGVKSAYKNSFLATGLTAIDYENTSGYHRWYTAPPSPDFDDEYLYDLDGNLTTCDLEHQIFLENSDEPPAIKYDIYNVYFDTNGGSSIPHQEVKVEEGNPAYVIEPDPSPSRYSYDFVGWYEDKSLFVLWDFDKAIPSDDFILYAKWECNHADKSLKHIDGLDDGWDPTCYKKGRQYEYCNNPACNKKLSDVPVEVDMTDHEWESYIEKAPTTTETGLKRYHCKHCGLVDPSRDEVIPMLESAEPLQPTDDPYVYNVNLVVGTQTTCDKIIKKKFDTSYKVSFSEKKIAAISSKGVIKGIKAGKTTATIHWKSGDDEIEYTFYITVKKPTFSEKQFILRVNQMISSGFNSDEETATGLPVYYTSSNANVLEIDTMGNITGRKYGKTKIYAMILGKKVASAWVFVEDPKISATELEMINGKNVTLKVKDNKQPIVWSSDNPAVAKVTKTGKVVPVSTGVTFIHAKVGTYDMKCTVKVDLPVLSETEKAIAFTEDDPNPSFELKVLNTAYGSEAEWITSGKHLEITPETGDTVTVICKEAGVQMVSCIINGRKITTCVKIYKPVIKCKDTIKMGKKMTVKMEGGLTTDMEWDIENVDGVAVMNYKGVFYPRKTGVVFIKLTTAGVTVKKKVTII